MLGGKIGLPELLILLAIVFFLFGAKRFRYQEDVLRRYREALA